MKQRLRKLFSWLLCFALIASAFVGALSASVLPAKADAETTGYVNDLFDRAKEDCPAAKQQILENIRTLYNTYFDNWLIVIIHDTNTSNWYFAAYEHNTAYTLSFWWYKDSYYSIFRPRVVGDNYMEQFHSCYGFKIKGTIFTELPTATQLGNVSFNGFDVFYNSSWMWNAPTPMDLSTSGREVYCNRDIKDRNYETFYTANLLPGSYVPPITEYHWFKFQLGDRWYITTTDQDYVNAMVVEDETYYVWELDIMYEDESFHTWYIDSSMMVRIPYAENFISQQLENVSPSGVYAYDITSWINNGIYVNASSVFNQVFTTPGGFSEWTYVAYSDDIVDFVLTEQQEEQTHNNAWTQINNYIINYPTISVVPEQLASQLAGDHAISAGFGKVQIPEQLVIWMNHGTSLRELDSDFHYGFTQSGLDPDDSTLRSMINYDILNVCIISSRGAAEPNVSGSTVSRIHMCEWLYTYENDPSDNYTVDVDPFAYFNHDDIWQTYDLVFIVDSDSKWLMDPRDEYNISNFSSLFFRNGYTGSDVKRGNFSEHTTNGQYPAYWVLTRSAILKSQLYVFCDSQNKLYKLLSDYIQKRDLWDDSFLEWSMSIFWELETIDGYLLRFEQEYKTWDLANKLSTIVTKLQEIADNTDETDVDPWYLALFNWIKAFEPSNFDFIGWVNEYDDFVDELPDPGGATIIPFPTAAPTVLPTVAGG